MQKLLVVEDDLDIQELLQNFLQEAGYRVTAANDGVEAVSLFSGSPFDLILLDVMLPKIDGFTVCECIRRQSQVPIIMLTARDTEMDEIKALELGVNDYLSKPFSLGVLKARMKRILQGKEEAEKIVTGALKIDQSTCKVYKRGEEISLSKLEYRLLLYLIENKNHILSKEQILERIWDSDGKYVDNNTVSVNISRLRAKIEDDISKPKWIQTVHGIGYIWKE